MKPENDQKDGKPTVIQHTAPVEIAPGILVGVAECCGNPNDCKCSVMCMCSCCECDLN